MSNSDKNPAHSVVIATHNRANLLPRAVNSVLNQTFEDFELIIVDDASSDETEQVAHSFQDPRVRYVKREANGGCPAAKNTGILHAKGEYVSLLDDDDEYLPEFLEEMYGAFEAASEHAGVGWCGRRYVKETLEGNSILKDSLWNPTFDSREEAFLSFLQSRKVGGASGITVRRSSVISEGMYDECLKKADDTDLLTRMVRHFDFVVVPKVLIKVYHHTGSRLTTYDQTMAESYDHLIQKHMETLRQHAHLWTALHYKAGWLHYHAGNKARARQYMMKALRKDPLHKNSWAGLLLFETLGLRGARLHKQISIWKGASKI